MTITEIQPGYFRPDHNDARVQEVAKSLRQYEFRGVPLFLDIGGALETPSAFVNIRDILNYRYTHVKEIDAVAMFDSRGFLFGTQIAQYLGVPCVMIRKKGKLPGTTLSYSYSTEYSSDTLSVNVESVKPGQRFLLVDDVLATGGTLLAGAKLIQALGGLIVECCVIASLDFLKGIEKIRSSHEDFADVSFFSIISTDQIPAPPVGHSTQSKDIELGSPEYFQFLSEKEDKKVALCGAAGCF